MATFSLSVSPGVPDLPETLIIDVDDHDSRSCTVLIDGAEIFNRRNATYPLSVSLSGHEVEALNFLGANKTRAEPFHPGESVVMTDGVYTLEVRLG